MFLDLNKMPAFYSLRRELLFFLPYKGYFSDLIHLPTERDFADLTPEGMEWHNSHISEHCLTPAFHVFSLVVTLPSLSPSGRFITTEKSGQGETKL